MAKKTEEQMREEIVELMGDIGFKYGEDRALTSHPDDWYLRVTYGYSESKSEYAVWIYNASLGSLQSGIYVTEREEALQEYETRK